MPPNQSKKSPKKKKGPPEPKKPPRWADEATKWLLTELDVVIFRDIPSYLISLPELKLLSRGAVRNRVAATIESEMNLVKQGQLPNNRAFWPDEWSDRWGAKLIKHLTRYAIFSHRWLPDGEPIFSEVLTGSYPESAGMEKLRKFCDTAVKDHGCQWAWSDTCCINKESSSQLEEAIRSMYTWYRNSAVCVVFLADVSSRKDMINSEWFRRGWTLQELLASETIKFYTKDWKLIVNNLDPENKTNHGSPYIPSDKEDYDIKKIISDATGISEDMVYDSASFMFPHGNGLSMARDIFVWASRRRTTRVEDEAYCLIGLLGLDFSIAYGEGERAFYRLQVELLRATGDIDILIWQGEQGDLGSMFAPRPSYFAVTESPLPDLRLQLQKGFNKSEAQPELLYQHWSQGFKPWLPSGDSQVSFQRQMLRMRLPLYKIQEPPYIFEWGDKWADILPRLPLRMPKPPPISVADFKYNTEDLDMPDKYLAVLDYDASGEYDTEIPSDEISKHQDLIVALMLVGGFGGADPKKNYWDLIKSIREKRLYTALVLGCRREGTKVTYYRLREMPCFFVERPDDGFKGLTTIDLR